MVCWHAGGTRGSGSAAQRAEQGEFGTSDLARYQCERCGQAHAAQQHFAARQHGEVSLPLCILCSSAGRMLKPYGRMAEPVSHCHSSDAHAGLAQQAVLSRQGGLQSTQLSRQLSLLLRRQTVRRQQAPSSVEISETSAGARRMSTVQSHVEDPAGVLTINGIACFRLPVMLMYLQLFLNHYA